MNLLYLTVAAARARPHCQVFGSDMKVSVAARNCFYYPDVSATCDTRDHGEASLSHPCFILEVLSPSTAGIDRREKRLAYATLASIDEYMIIDQDRMHVTVYAGKLSPWASQVLTEPRQQIEICCLNLRVSLEEIYRGIEFPVPGVAEPEVAAYDAFA